MVTAASISRSLTAKLRGGGGGGGGALAALASNKPWTSPPGSPASFCSSAVVGSSVSDPASAAAASSQAQENQRRWSRWLLFIPGAITFGLGTWQVFRRQDKVTMLEYRRMRLNLEPLKLSDVTLSSENLDSLEFRKVACAGVFDDQRSTFVGPRSRSISGVTENGYYLITPLMPIANNSGSVQSPVLVNRGWVPRSWRDDFLKTVEEDHEQSPSSSPPRAPEVEHRRHWWDFWSKTPKTTEDLDVVSSVTPVEVIGVVRGSEKPSIFVPENDPSSGQWFYVDIPAIARACGLPEDTIYVEDINENVNPSNPYPIPKDVNTLIRSSVMPQDHLNYMLTWYSLSAAVTFMAFKRLRPRKNRR